MIRWLFTAIAIIACGCLIPVNVVYNLKNVSSEERDFLSMLTLRDLTGTVLFVHVAASYVFAFLVMFFVWVNWKRMIQLRLKWFRSPEYMQSFYARTLMVQKVPKKYQSDEGIRNILETVQVPYPATSVHVGRRVGRLPELIEFHNDAVRELEKVLVRYLKGGKIAEKRPTLRKGGFMGIGGTKYDAIDFYTSVKVSHILFCLHADGLALFIVTRSSGVRRLSQHTERRLTRAERRTMVSRLWLRYHMHISSLTCSAIRNRKGRLWLWLPILKIS